MMQNAQINRLNAKENNYTSVCVCYVQYSFTPTHFNVTKSESNQRTRQKKNPRIGIHKENPINSTIQFQEKLKSQK